MTRFPLRLFITFLFGIAYLNAFSQNENELYLFSLEKSSKGEYHLHSAKYLSSFNYSGFSNQPSFTPGGDLLLSVRKSGESQNDIWLLGLNSRKIKRLTNTKAIEYSPRIHPDEEHLTVLRKLDSDDLDQQVCNIHLRTGEIKCLEPNLKDVGYYTWLTDHEMGLYRIEGTTSRLSYYNVEENKSRRITSSIGRTLLSDKAGHIIYVHKFTDDYWYIKKYNPSNSAIEIVTQTVSKNEDFALAADGTYFMGKDHLLYSYHADRGKEWKQVADLSIYGIKYISRLSVSPDGKRLVVVTTKVKS